MTPTKGTKRGLVLWFAAGAFVIASLGWAWVDSATYQRIAFWKTAGDGSPRLEHWRGNLTIEWVKSRAFTSVPPGTIGIRSYEQKPLMYLGGELPRFYSHKADYEQPAATGCLLPYWVLMGGTAVSWVGLPCWLHWRRKRQQVHLQAEDLLAGP